MEQQLPFVEDEKNLIRQGWIPGVKNIEFCREKYFYKPISVILLETKEGEKMCLCTTFIALGSESPIMKYRGIHASEKCYVFPFFKYDETEKISNFHDICPGVLNFECHGENYFYKHTSVIPLEGENVYLCTTVLALGSESPIMKYVEMQMSEKGQ